MMYMYKMILWFFMKIVTFIHSLAIKVVKSGPVPRHVAMIMDGNRRFANKNGLEKIDGHIQGYNTLIKTLEWCVELGIKEITYYAFSIENFKRSEKEVSNILDLARQKFRKIIENENDFLGKRIRVKIIGNMSLLPKDLQWLMAEAMRLTKDSDRIILNIAFPYTSRDEITNAMKDIVKGVKRGEIKEDDIDENLITECLYTYELGEVDLLIRTSGEYRFSDYLMWQTSHACLYFTKVLWPEFSEWDFTKALLYYQRCHKDMKKLENDLKPDVSNISDRVMNFIDKVHNKREMKFEQIAINSKI